MSVRNGYVELGVDNYYETHKNDYENPHKEIIQNLLLIAKNNWNLGESFLDLCCGSGEVTEVFLDKEIEGLDPYTYELYKEKTNKHCIKQSFLDIVEKGLEKEYDTVICSFAMHLCESSLLPMLLYRLSEKTKQLLILTPHKRPNCDGIYGWKLEKELKLNKVTMKLYVLE